MTALGNISEVLAENEIRWELLILAREAGQLQREHRHLSLKAAERPLTIWEQLRLHESLSDLTEIAQQMTRVEELSIAGTAAV